MKLTKTVIVLLAVVFTLSCSEINPAYAKSKTVNVAINEKNFPDKNFRAYIKKAFDTDGNGYLNEEEIFYIRNVHCENMNITSVKGIEYFPYLIGLWCLNNHISSWDLSGNPHLKGIWCSHNDFTSLDFSDCPELEWVYCFNCKLKSLNIKNNPELAYIECNANPDLKKLDLSGNPKLENIFCSECGLTSLDLSNNPLLCELDAFKNKLTSINFSNNLLLKRLDIWDNWGLGNVDISMLKGLQFYNCARNNVTQLDMSNNPELTMLVCSYNENLVSLDVSKNPKLAYLNLECDWRLPSLDVSKNPKLYHLYAFGLRSISTLDISSNNRLIKTFNEGILMDEPQLGEVKSYTLNYGGSGDYFDDLKHELVVDNDVKIVSGKIRKSNVVDSSINTNDGHSNSERFATRGQAINLLYEMAGSPTVKGSSRFTDITDSPYKTAITWGEQNNICFGYPDICADSFCPDELINREDFGLMAHRYAEYLGFGTAFDYGRSDWFDDFYDIEFYAWGAFTWSIQWEVLQTYDNYCYPHGRLTVEELQKGAAQIFDLDEGASYSQRVNGNGE